MADRKATNKYYPPDWDPSKGSINQYVGQHPLRERARKLDQGILIVRFELPFNIWCSGCENHLGQGVRYNAEKKKVGNYYSTPILSFRMKCHLCDNWFEIRTDPKNAQYVVTEGARKKHEDFDAADAETLSLDTQEELERRTRDDFAKLEHAQLDELKAHAGMTVLTRLQRLNDRQWSDPYALSQRLRRDFRELKKARVQEEVACQQLADRIGFSFRVLPETDQDRVEAKNALLRGSDESGGGDGDGSRQQDSATRRHQQLALAKTRGLFETRAPSSSSSSERGKRSNTALGTITTTASMSSLGSAGKRTGMAGAGNGSAGTLAKGQLAQTVRANTLLKTDPFLSSSSAKSYAGLAVKPQKKRDAAQGSTTTMTDEFTACTPSTTTTTTVTQPKSGGLVNYATDSESD